MTSEEKIVKIMEKEYTPSRAVALGIAMILAANPLLQFNPFPFAPLLGLLFWLLGPTAIVVGFFDWLTRKLPWLRRFVKEEFVKMWEGNIDRV